MLHPGGKTQGSLEPFLSHPPVFDLRQVNKLHQLVNHFQGVQLQEEHVGSGNPAFYQNLNPPSKRKKKYL